MVSDEEPNLPENEIIVLVVNDGRNTTVGVVFGVLRALLLALTEVEVDGFVRKAKLLEDEGNLPIIAQSELYRELVQRELAIHWVRWRECKE